MAVHSVTPVAAPSTPSSSATPNGASAGAPAQEPAVRAASAEPTRQDGAPAARAAGSAAPAQEPAASADTTVETDIDPAALKRFTKLSKEHRQAQAKIKELEAQVEAGKGYQSAAEKLKAIEAAKAAGKRLDVLKAVGMDSTEDLDALLNEAMGTGGAEPDPKALVELRDKLDAVQKRLSDEDAAKDAAKKEADEKAAQTRREQERVAATAAITETLKAGAAKWPRCSREPEAVDLVMGDVVNAIKKLGRSVSDAETDRLITLAFDQREGDFKARGERYHIDEQPRNRPLTNRREPRVSDTGIRRTPAPTIDGNRGSLRSTTPTKQYVTAKQAKEEVLKAMRERRRSA